MGKTKKAIKLLENQIEKLNRADFDLEAWKSGTIMILHRLFGSDNVRAKAIAAMKIDYSSWALRDSSSNYNPIESNKKLGRELLLTAVEEIEMMGLPDEEAKEDNTNGLDEVLEAVISKQDYKKLQKLASSFDTKGSAMTDLEQLIESWDEETRKKLIVAILRMHFE